MKKIISLLLVGVLLSGVPVATFASEPVPPINYTNFDTIPTATGAIGVRFLNAGEARVKTAVQKTEDTKVSYFYDLFKLKDFEYFPLQLGNGQYTVSIYENVVDNKYRVADRSTVTADVENMVDVFKNTIQTVNWRKDMATIEKANDLSKGLKTDKQKIDAIYQFVIKYFSYDYDKIKTLQTTYVPDVDTILKDKKGICYDYAAVFAAMLRSQGIPAKLIKGYTQNVSEYHAWNEVYLADEARWVVVDTTFDSVYAKAGRKTKLEQKASLYKAEKEY